MPETPQNVHKTPNLNVIISTGAANDATQVALDAREADRRRQHLPPIPRAHRRRRAQADRPRSGKHGKAIYTHVSSKSIGCVNVAEGAGCVFAQPSLHLLVDHFVWLAGENAQRLPHGTARRAGRAPREAGRHAGRDQRAHGQDVVNVIDGNVIILNSTCTHITFSIFVLHTRIAI